MGMKNWATGIWNHMDAHTGKYALGSAGAGAFAGGLMGGTGNDGSTGKAIAGGIAGGLLGVGAAVGAFRGLGAFSKAGVGSMASKASHTEATVGPPSRYAMGPARPGMHGGVTEE